MTAEIDLELAVDHGSARPRDVRLWLTLVFIGLWAIVGLVAVPLLAFGLERTGAIFGGWVRSSELYMWVLTIGTSLLYLCVLVGLSLALAFRKRLSAAAFGILLVGSITMYSAVYSGHPEWFREVISVITS